MRRRLDVAVLGDVVMDRFRLLEPLGSGGMGTVYRAFDERLQRYVAVKELQSGGSERVLREAQAAARLNHPAIVTLYEYGTQDGRALLVSELVAGATLAELTVAGELTDRDVAEIGADVADALAHAHSRGVVHRDVKPHNVIVRDDDGGGRRAKLMDFGIARLVDAPMLTATGEVLGTLAYMAPEQAEGLGAGPEADVYSLALSLYECWAGDNPVRCESPAETARTIGAELPSLAAYRPDLPAAMVDVVDGCLDPDPELRPQLDELADTLAHEMHWLEDARPLPAREARHREPLPWGRLTAATGSLALAPALGALAAGGAYPALAGALGRSAPSRFMLGVAGWFAMLAGTLALDLPPHLGIHHPAGESVLVPLADPASLLGAAIFGLAAVAMGWILGARHVAMALLGAVLWAAALSGALELVGNGVLASRPPVLAIASIGAVVVVFAGREVIPVHLRSTPARAHPAHGA
jgi:hypothetical protein